MWRGKYRQQYTYVLVTDLEYVRMLFEDFHRSFNTPEQLPGPSDATGNGRKVSRRRGTTLLRLVYDTHLLQVLSIWQQDLFVLGSHVQLTCIYLLKFQQQIERLFRLIYSTTQHRCSRRRQTSPPVPPPGDLDETYASSLILPFRSIMCKHDVIHKTGST